MLWLFPSLLVWCHGYTSALTVESRTLLTYEESYYEYVPDRLPWHSAERLCNQRSGALATVSSALENQELSRFLKSLNISHPVWITRKVMTHLKNPMETLILEFVGRSHQKNARLLHKFPSMMSVTVCTRLRVDPSCFGFSTIFSYSIQSYINEFQLRASLIQGRPVQLALLVHGTHEPYHEAFSHDGSWHSVCVSWSQNGGRWTLFTDGLPVGRGSGLHSGQSIGPDGLFIIGQEQDTFGGSFKKDESFWGSLTQLHIWDRVLNNSEIHTMEKDCSPISSGLVFKWSSTALEVESTLTRQLGDTPCQGIFPLQLRDTGTSFLSYHNFSREVVHALQAEWCVTFDPVNGSWGQDKCDSSKGAVCQFQKEAMDVFSFPKTTFFSRLSKDPLVKPVMDTMRANASLYRDLSSVEHLTEAVLRIMETGGPDLLTPSDVLYLSQEMVPDMAGANAAEVMVSIASTYLKLASLMLEPDKVTQWMGLTEDGVSVGPYTIVRSIDRLTEALADVLSAEGRGFTLSTKNLDVHMEWQRLSQASCRHVFKPSTLGTHTASSSQDELLITDFELQRLHTLGYEKVMFIHTYYSRLNEILSGTEQETSSKNQNNMEGLIGHLTTAVISAAVRDPSKAQTIPVTVQYTLSSSHVAEYSQSVTPVCVFWNFSLMQSNANSWSSEGCRVTHAGSDVTSCLCDHTTNFAVLMNYLESKWSPEEEVILTKLTFIGSGASLCALLVTLMLFTVLDIPKSDRTSIHKNLFIALICAQVVLLCSGSAIHNKVACTLVAALLHLFFMAAFSWMLVEGLLLWSKVVTVNLSEDQHMKYYYLIGWGLPVLIVTITLASASGKYSADGHCWLSVQNGVIWGFAGPVIFIITVNIMVLARVVVITISTARRRSIMLALGASPMEQAYEQFRAAVKAVLVLLPILGLTWICGVLVPLSIIMAYIFILLNSLQGLFIFLIYGVYNTEVRSTVNRIKERRKALNFSNCASSRPSSSVASSRPASSPLPGPIGPHTPSQGEEAIPLPTPTYTQPHTMAVDRGEKVGECAEGQLSIPCAPERQENRRSHTTNGIQHRKESPSSKTDGSPAGCSLHVPMELEFTTSCFPRSPAHQKRSGLVCID
ncbi:adhesion G-protein coupled receptor D2 [Lampris incognitus]|uniref:adhesion G-protein coupled receptor D2 n=1 Tax=Lampris incognitus TaxID=2546036 RepID=UPI0024B58601|nr:adhesion G-protein coupled receptor D2 [Lampris incognitus]